MAGDVRAAECGGWLAAGAGGRHGHRAAGVERLAVCGSCWRQVVGAVAGGVASVTAGGGGRRLAGADPVGGRQLRAAVGGCTRGRRRGSRPGRVHGRRPPPWQVDDSSVRASLPGPHPRRRWTHSGGCTGRRAARVWGRRRSSRARAPPHPFERVCVASGGSVCTWRRLGACEGEGGCSEANHLVRNSVMDESIGGSEGVAGFGMQ